MSIRFCSMLVAAGLLAIGSAAATSITFRMSVPNASGENNLVPFTNQPIVLTVQADTSRVIPLANLAGEGPGNCVPADSTSISVGGAVALQAAPPVFFCATVNASIVGVFTTSPPTVATVYFAGNYTAVGITDFALASNFPSAPNVFSLTKVTSDALNLTGGGTASIAVVPDEGTTFAAALSPAGIPTLGVIELAGLFLLLVLAGMVAIARRTLT
jgi:hypothetical protein